MYRSPLVDRRGAVPGHGPGAAVAWHYGDPFGEQRALEAHAAVVDLSHYGVARVAGADRHSWLHSLTTQQLAGLAPRTSTELLILSPVGHIEHHGAVVDDGTATFLITEPHRAVPLVTWLDSMRFRLRVEVADVSAELAALGEPVAAEGLAGEPVTWRDPWPRVTPGGTRYGPPDAEHPGATRPWRLVLVERARLSDAVGQRQDAGWRLAGTWASEALRIAAWRPQMAEVDRRTIPHELDWLRTAVHLRKGCYRGQETVARVHNLGRPPRRLVMLHLDGSANLLPEPGAPVLLDGDPVDGDPVDGDPVDGDPVDGEPGPDQTPAEGLPAVWRGAQGGGAGRPVGRVTSAARHHELGPIALAVIRRSVPAQAPLVVDVGGVGLAAAQEIIVSPDGVSADRPPAPGPVAKLGPPRPNIRSARP